MLRFLSSATSQLVALRRTARKAGTVTGDPPVRRRLVGGALRRYRENVGYALEDAARVLAEQHSKTFDRDTR